MVTQQGENPRLRVLAGRLLGVFCFSIELGQRPEVRRESRAPS